MRATADSQALSLQQYGHQRFSMRNYLAHALEGGCYMGGIAFLAEETVLPAMFASLGAPTWLIAHAPVLMMLGFVLPSLFTAHIFERRERMIPFLLVSGIFQRLPFLIGALMLFFFAADMPVLTMVVVAAVPFCSGLFGGLGGPAWMELTSKILPPNRRASSLAIRMVTGALIGICAGYVVEAVLARHPGATGYGILHLCTFGFLVASYVLFTLQREAPDRRRASAPRIGLWQNLRSLPVLLRAHPELRRLMITIACALSVWIVVPFMALHAKQSLGLPDAFIGRLVVAQMIGMVAGNLVGGLIGDRFGGRAMFQMALVGELAVFVGCNVAGSELGFQTVFFLWGAAFNLHRLGGFILSMEVVPVDRRPTGLAMMGLVNAPGLLLMTTIGGQLQTWLPGDGQRVLIPALVAGSFTLVALWALAGVRRPAGIPVGDRTDSEA
ncbi:MAG: MFS transporter [Planctomycetota bacterium]